VRDDLRVADGDATERRDVHEAEIEIPADRRRGIIGELEQRPELVARSVVERNPDAVRVGWCG